MPRYLLSGEDERVAAWVADRVRNFEPERYPYTAIGQVDGLGNLVGGVVFHTFTKRDIHMTVAGHGKRWLTRHFLGECFRYAFNQLGAARVTIEIADSNAHSKEFCTKLGFVFEGKRREMLEGDEDLWVLGMLKRECRWLTVGVSRAKHRTAVRRFG